MYVRTALHLNELIRNHKINTSNALHARESSQQQQQHKIRQFKTKVSAITYAFILHFDFVITLTHYK